VRIDPRDPRDDPVRFRQIEARIGAERHDGSGTPLGAFTRDDAEHAARRVVTQMPITLWKREDGGQRKALDPIVELAGTIARILSSLERRNDDDANPQRCDVSAGRRRKRSEREKHDRRYRQSAAARTKMFAEPMCHRGVLRITVRECVGRSHKRCGPAFVRPVPHAARANAVSAALAPERDRRTRRKVPFRTLRRGERCERHKRRMSNGHRSSRSEP